MNDPESHSLEAILRHCESAAPNPWYPSAHARNTETSRDWMDPLLNELRVAGLIQLTPWGPEHGQGYVLTPAGVQALQSTRAVHKLRAGEMPAVQYREAPPITLERERSTPWARGEAVREIFIGSFTPTVTFALILLNVLTFIAGLTLAAMNNVSITAYLDGRDQSGEVRKIQDDIGFLSGTDVHVRGQWWRLLTACFGHVGWIHLVMNMVSLYLLGPFFERLWGGWRFLVLYLLAGLGGSCGALIENPIGGGAGASGALCGMIASLAVWLVMNRNAVDPRTLAQWQRMLGVNFMLILIMTFAVEHVSKGGHIGGALIGLAAAIPLDYLRFGTTSQRGWALVGLVSIPIICIAIVLRSFIFTGPVMDLRYTYSRAAETYDNRARPLMRGPVKDQDGAEAKQIADELARDRAKLEELLEAPRRPTPRWLPNLDAEWQFWAEHARRFLPHLAFAVASLNPPKPTPPK